MTRSLTRCTVLSGALAAAISFPLSAIGATSVPVDLAQFVPDDAVAIVYTDSLSGLTQSLSATASAVDPSAAFMIAMAGPESMLKSSIKTQQSFMFDQPAAVAISLGTTPTDPPKATIIFGVKGADATNVTLPKNGAMASQGFALAFADGGSYIALTQVSDFATSSGSNTLLDEIPDGSICAVIDADALMAEFGPMAQGLASMVPMMVQQQVGGGMDHEATEAQSKAISTGLTKLLDFAGELKIASLSLQLDEADIEVIATLTSKEPHDCGDGLNSAAARLPVSLPMTAVVNKETMDLLLGLSQLSAAGMPPAFAKGYAPIMESVMKLMGLVDGATGVSSGLGAGGFDAVQVYQVSDVSSFMTELDALAKTMTDSGLGFRFVPMPMLAGGQGRAFRLFVDEDDLIAEISAQSPGQTVPPEAKKQIGEMFQAMGLTKGLPVRFVSQGNWVAMVTGKPKLLGTAKQLLKGTATASNEIASMVEAGGGTGIGAVSIDLRGMLSGMVAFMESVPGLAPGPIPTVPSGDPVMIDLFATCHGDSLSFELHGDIKSTADLLKAMSGMDSGDSGPATF